MKKTILIGALIGFAMPCFGQNTPNGSGREPAFGIQFGGWTGTKFNYVKVEDDGSVDVKVTSGGGTVTLTGAANYANGQVTATTTAATLIATRATRRNVLVRNLDAAISVYIGKATVTSGNGMILKAGESVSLDTNQLVQVIAASGTPVVAYLETYD